MARQRRARWPRSTTDASPRGPTPCTPIASCRARDLISARWWLAGLVAALLCAPAAAAASAERSAPAGSVAVVISPAAEGLGEATLRVAAALSAAGLRGLGAGLP